MSDDFLTAGAGFSPGKRIGGYLLHEQVGHGGMAVVYRASDERLGRPVALKVLAPALAADEAFRQRFINESRAAAAVDDPHIIPVFEAGEASGVLFIAMRYVQGGDVRSLLHHQGAMAPARVASIVSPIASALDAAHAAGLIHRDVKPANMLLDRRPGRPDHVYLSDFGLTKEALGSVGLTGTGLFLGTAGYASPEQVNGSRVDGRADQYALGCAAFEMLCGRPPFQRDQPMAVLLAHLHEPPPALSPLRPGLPGAVDAVFARALAKDPDHRYRTCADFGDALRRAFGLAPYEDGASAGHAATEVARPASGPDVATVAGLGATAAAAADEVTPRPVVPGLRAPQQPAPYMQGGRAAERAGRPGSRWPVALAWTSAAAVLVAVAAVVLFFKFHNAPTGAGSGSPGSAKHHHRGGHHVTHPLAVTNLNNVWIAQLVAVPFSDGKAALYSRLDKIRRQVPRAHYASSADYGSLTQGFWMIFYYSPAFTDGTKALAYCDAIGRTTNYQCFGTLLSHDVAYRTTRCYPSAPTASTCYVRP